jgi:hypothetical protein
MPCFVLELHLLGLPYNQLRAYMNSYVMHFLIEKQYVQGKKMKRMIDLEIV